MWRWGTKKLNDDNLLASEDLNLHSHHRARDNVHSQASWAPSLSLPPSGAEPLVATDYGWALQVESAEQEIHIIEGGKPENLETCGEFLGFASPHGAPRPQAT